MDTFHDPVLLAEVIALAPAARRIVDGTLGDGGHTAAFLARGAAVLGIDRDPTAIERARARLADPGVSFHQGNVFEPPALTAIAAWRPDLILLDLGVSSRQLDDSERGFTFRPEARLDMRMGEEPETAADLLNEASESELTQIFKDYSDEPRAARLAREVVRRRARAPFEISDHLVNAIRAVLGSRSGPSDFARIFQGLRIAVNREIERLAEGLDPLRERLDRSGLLAVISYHSSEDRIVKHTFREWSRSCVCPPAAPICTCRGHALGELVTRKAIRPGPAEVAANPRARSAKLRAFRRD